MRTPRCSISGRRIQLTGVSAPVAYRSSTAAEADTSDAIIQRCLINAAWQGIIQDVPPLHPESPKTGDCGTASERSERAGQEPTREGRLRRPSGLRATHESPADNGRLTGFCCSFYQRAEGERSKRCALCILHTNIDASLTTKTSECWYEMHLFYFR
jgi:hypothetical protein